MRVRVKAKWGELKVGDVVEAIKNPTTDSVAVFDSAGSLYYYTLNSDAELVEDTIDNKEVASEVKVQPQQISSSKITDHFGQKLKTLHVEFLE